MFHPDLFLSLAALNWILFVSFGIWFTLVCFVKMLETAVQVIDSEDQDLQH